MYCPGSSVCWLLPLSIRILSRLFAYGRSHACSSGSSPRDGTWAAGGEPWLHFDFGKTRAVLALNSFVVGDFVAIYSVIWAPRVPKPHRVKRPPWTLAAFISQHLQCLSSIYLTLPPSTIEAMLTCDLSVAVTPLCPPLPKPCQLAPRLALLALTPAPFRPDFHSLDWLISFRPIEPGADDDVQSHPTVQVRRLQSSLGSTSLPPSPSPTSR